MENLKSLALEERSAIVSQITVLNSKLKAIDDFLKSVYGVSEVKRMCIGDKRRKGGMNQVLQSLQSIQSGSIRQIAEKLMDIFPVQDEQNTYSKVATYLKRLQKDGQIYCAKNGTVKTYSINPL